MNHWGCEIGRADINLSSDNRIPFSLFDVRVSGFTIVIVKTPGVWGGLDGRGEERLKKSCRAKEEEKGGEGRD